MLAMPLVVWGRSCVGTIVVGCVSGSGWVGDCGGGGGGGGDDCSGSDDGGASAGGGYEVHSFSYCDSVISEAAPPRTCV